MCTYARSRSGLIIHFKRPTYIDDDGDRLYIFARRKIHVTAALGENETVPSVAVVVAAVADAVTLLAKGAREATV